MASPNLHTRHPPPISEPMEAKANGEAVLVLAGSEAMTITPEAAEESARRLLAAAAQVRASQT